MDIWIWGYVDIWIFNESCNVRRFCVKYLNYRRLIVELSQNYRKILVKDSSNVRQIFEFSLIVVDLSSNIVNYHRIIVKWILYT